MALTSTVLLTGQDELFLLRGDAGPAGLLHRFELLEPLQPLEDCLEVGEKATNDLKLMAWAEEDACLAGVRR